MQTITIQNCTVELSVPDILEMSGVSGPSKQPKVRLTSSEYVLDVLVRMPDGRVVTIKKLHLRQLLGTMVPVVDENNNVVLFTVTDQLPTNSTEPDVLVESK